MQHLLISFPHAEPYGKFLWLTVACSFVLYVNCFLNLQFLKEFSSRSLTVIIIQHGNIFFAWQGCVFVGHVYWVRSPGALTQWAVSFHDDLGSILIQENQHWLVWYHLPRCQTKGQQFHPHHCTISFSPVCMCVNHNFQPLRGNELGIWIFVRSDTKY